MNLHMQCTNTGMCRRNTTTKNSKLGKENTNSRTLKEERKSNINLEIGNKWRKPPKKKRTSPDRQTFSIEAGRHPGLKMPDSKDMEPFHVSMIVRAIHLISWFYDVATYIPWQLATYSSWQYQNRLKAIPMSGDTKKPWRMVDREVLKLRRREDCVTLAEDFERNCQEYGSLEALGTREILSEEDEVQSNGKVFKKLIMGDYKWRTYTDFFQDADNFGKGLVSLGLQPKQNILIFAETRAEFQIGLQACFRYNFPVVTLYATLGEAAISYGINQTGIKYVITTTTLLAKLKSIQKDIPSVTHIICMEDPVTKLDEKKLSNGIKVTSFQSVVNKGAASKNVQRVKPTADDLAIIMYTSGSTGNPKGVMISHKNVLAAVCGAVDRINDVEIGETAAVYLPLAHILEVVVELSLVTLGCRLGYSSPQTLTDTGTKLKKGCPGDVRILKPNLMVFVPMVLERIYRGVTEKVKEGSAIQRAIFNFAVDYKSKHLEQGFNTPILNRLIFSKLTRQLGGNVRLMICGGAPLASNLQRFIQSCFNSSLIQGYGLTETCGVACVSESRDMRIGHVGPPLTSTQVKLVDWPEGGYTNQDKPNPRGEVIVGGQNIAMGYYQMDQLTKEVFIQDNGIRYFCTGDIGEFLPDGSLRIIDRKKDLVKLQTGEYISLATIENFLKKSPFVENICIYADPMYDYCIALVVPYKKALQEAANNNDLNGKSFEELCGRSEMKKEVLSSLASMGKEAKLQKWEVPRKVHLCEELWTPENGLVTDAFKLKRKPIANHYSAAIKTMYGQH